MFPPPSTVINLQNLAQSATNSPGACFKTVQSFKIRALTVSGRVTAPSRRHTRRHLSNGAEKDCVGSMSQRVLMKENVVEMLNASQNDLSLTAVFISLVVLRSRFDCVSSNLQAVFVMSCHSSTARHPRTGGYAGAPQETPPKRRKQQLWAAH